MKKKDWGLILHRRVRSLTKAVRIGAPKVFIEKEAELIAEAYEGLMRSCPVWSRAMDRDDAEREARHNKFMDDYLDSKGIR